MAAEDPPYDGGAILDAIRSGAANLRGLVASLRLDDRVDFEHEYLKLDGIHLYGATRSEDHLSGIETAAGIVLSPLSSGGKATDGA